MKTLFSFSWFVALSTLFCSCSHRESLDTKIVIPHIVNARLLKDAPGPYITVVKEALEKDRYSKPQPCYSLKPQGFHPGDLYFGYRFNANYQQHGLGEFVVNDDGDLTWKNLELTLGTMQWVGGGFVNGEQMFHVLVSEDEQQHIVTVITPDPIEYRWEEDGAYASLALLEYKEWVFFLAGKGFKPNEEIVLTSIDNDVRFDANIKADAEGMLFCILPPTAPLKEKEKATLTIKRHQSTEIPTLTYLYGRAALVKAMPKKYPTIESVTPEVLNKSYPPFVIVSS